MAEMKKVAFVLPSLAGGGCERIASALIPKAAARCSLEVILHQKEIAYPVPETVPIHVLGNDTSADHGLLRKGIRFVMRILRLRRRLRLGRYDLVVSFMDMNNVVSWLACRLAGGGMAQMAVEQTVTEGFFLHNPHAKRFAPVMKVLLCWVYTRVPVLVVLSRSMEAYLRRALSIDRPVEVIYNGVDTEVYCPVPASGDVSGDHAVEPEFRDAGLCLLNVGRLDRCQKNQESLIRLFSDFSRKHPKARLFFIGDGENRSSLEEEVNRLGLSERVFFLGWKTNLAAYYRAADVLLHCSRYESFGNVLVESLACATPVAVTVCDPVIGEVLGEIPSAVLVAEGDDAAFSRAIETAAAISTEVRMAGATRAAASYSMEAVTDRYLAVIERTLGGTKKKQHRGRQAS